MPEAIRFIVTNRGADGYDQELAGLSCEISARPMPTDTVDRMFRYTSQSAIDFGQRPLADEPIRCNVPLQPLRWYLIPRVSMAPFIEDMGMAPLLGGFRWPGIFGMFHLMGATSQGGP